MADLAEVSSFQRDQEHVTIACGALARVLDAFLERCEQDPRHTEDPVSLAYIARELKYFPSAIHQECAGLDHHPHYFNRLGRCVNRISSAVAEQTTRQRKPAADFMSNIRDQRDGTVDIMMAVSRLPPPPMDATIVAGSAFTAYLFFTRLFSTVRDYLAIIDPYLGTEVFDLYLSRLAPSVKVLICSSPGKWTAREQVEAVEKTYHLEHPEYERVDDYSIHDRLIITEGGGWQLGGSLKDAAKESDYSVIRLDPERVEKTLNRFGHRLGIKVDREFEDKD